MGETWRAEFGPDLVVGRKYGKIKMRGATFMDSKLALPVFEGSY